MTRQNLNISFIGFGEAAQAFATGLQLEEIQINISAFDIKTEGPNGAAKWAEYQAHNVKGAETCAQLVAEADVIYSLVTAEQSLTAAKNAARSDLHDAFYFDCNSCAPNTKREAADIITAAGGRYVDMAVMTPVLPDLHKSASLMAGPHAAAAEDVVRHLGMNVENVGLDIGDASTRKMIRSVMIKGLEALTLECFLAARQAGIETNILTTLEGSYPGFDWARRAPYMIERMATHGIRRAAEMKEVAKTLHDLGVASHMTDGTVARQSETGALGLKVSAEDARDLAKLTDSVFSHLKIDKS